MVIKEPDPCGKLLVQKTYSTTKLNFHDIRFIEIKKNVTDLDFWCNNCWLLV